MMIVKTIWLLHRLNSSKHAPSGYDILKIATNGSAKILGRSDIGQLSIGMMADLFMVDSTKAELVGADYDTKSMLATVGTKEPVALTMVQGEVVVRDGILQNVDEEKVAAEGRKVVKQLLSK